MEYKYLSHVLENEIPVYGNNNKVCLNFKPLKSISNGDSANISQFTMGNHWGTHIDAPAHFFEHAPSVTDYPPEYWFFNQPQILNIQIFENELIMIEHFKNRIIDDKADLLLIKTGFQNYRGTVKYTINNPGLHSEVGLWLRKSLKSIRAIGFDFISISAYQNREEGRRAHRAFLDPDGTGNPILIIEDMNLDYGSNDPNRVLVCPLLLKGVDSTPCTVIGAFE
jgi:kynurenine formamidase